MRSKRKAQVDIQRLVKFIIWILVIIIIGLGINFLLKRFGVIG